MIWRKVTFAAVGFGFLLWPYSQTLGLAADSHAILFCPHISAGVHLGALFISETAQAVARPTASARHSSWDFLQHICLGR